MVLCLQGSGLIMVKQQVVSWTDCVIHTFIYLLQTLIEWRLLDISHHIQLISYIFYQEGFCECVVLETVTPEPFDHVVMSCCLPGKVFLWIALAL